MNMQIVLLLSALVVQAEPSLLNITVFAGEKG